MNSQTINWVLVALMAVTLSGCAARSAMLPGELRPMHTVSEFSDDESVSRTRDPWEGFNRNIYKFNYQADRYLFLPVVAGYEKVVPRVARTGVSNFFVNLGEIPTFYNCLLQGKGKKSLVTFGRFLVNSTIGIGGLFDPASAFGWRRHKETFDRTLESWGVGSGPYLVVPVLGPNTLRSAGGLAVDGAVRWAITGAINPFGGTGASTQINEGVMGLETVDVRYREPFRYYDSDYPFEYYMVRYLSSEKRELQIMR